MTTFFEEIRVSGENLVDEISKLINEGNVRRITVKNPDGKVLFETPLTLGAVGVSALFLFHPILTALGAFAMYTNDLRVEVERYEKDEFDNDREVDADVIDVEGDEE